VTPNLSPRAVARAVLVVLGVLFAIYLIYLLRRPITWIFIAGFLAIALSGPVNRLQRRMRRGLAITIVYLVLFLVPVGLVALLLPPIVEQLNHLVQNLPGYVNDLQKLVEKNKTLRELEANYNITEQLQKQASALPNKLGDAAGILSNVGIGVVNSVFAAVTIIVLSLFMIGSGRRFLDSVADRQPPARADWMKNLFDRIGSTVANYVAGALGQALIAGISSWIVLMALGVPYAASLAVIIFLLDLVPLVGATIGAVIVGIVTLFSDFPIDTVIWIVWSVIYQQVENSLIQPRIQSRAVAVHPFVVLVSVLFGSTLFGVLGALLAIPIAAAIQILIAEWAKMPRPSKVVTVRGSAVTSEEGSAQPVTPALIVPPTMDPAPPKGEEA
jgi:predicted PurR-regulated permease PerM